MARFTIAKRTPRSNGWRDKQLKNAQLLVGKNFDASDITPEQFIEDLKNNHLREISKTFKQD